MARLQTQYPATGSDTGQTIRTPDHSKQSLRNSSSRTLHTPVTNEVVNQQTFSASEPATGKARERRHSGPMSSERNAAGGRLWSARRACLSASVDCVLGAWCSPRYTCAPTPCHERWEPSWMFA